MRADLHRRHEVERAVHLAAGMAAVCVMREAPDVAMPTRAVQDGCVGVLELLDAGELCDHNLIPVLGRWFRPGWKCVRCQRWFRERSRP